MRNVAMTFISDYNTRTNFYGNTTCSSTEKYTSIYTEAW
jgi:hypothetical protein